MIFSYLKALIVDLILILETKSHNEYFHPLVTTYTKRALNTKHSIALTSDKKYTYSRANIFLCGYKSEVYS